MHSHCPSGKVRAGTLLSSVRVTCRGCTGVGGMGVQK